MLRCWNCETTWHFKLCFFEILSVLCYLFLFLFNMKVWNLWHFENFNILSIWKFEMLKLWKILFEGKHITCEFKELNWNFELLEMWTVELYKIWNFEKLKLWKHDNLSLFKNLLFGVCLLFLFRKFKNLMCTWYPLPGTSTWYLVPGTRYQVPGTWYQVPGTMYWVPGTRY